MELSTNQIELIQRINEKLLRGDIKAISQNTGLTRVYVSMVLNPFSTSYNQNVLTEAVSIITKRDQATKKLLQKI